MRTALITGAAGQDGILLARSLISAGYRVMGTVTDVATLQGCVRHVCTGPRRARA